MRRLASVITNVTILAEDTSRMTAACDQVTAALDRLKKAVLPGVTLTQQELSRQLHWEGTQFYSLHQQTAGLIEDEKCVRGMTTNLVRQILNLESEPQWQDSH